MTTRDIILHAAEIFHKLRYPNDIVYCPYCGCCEVREYGDYKYRCKGCGNRFTDRTRTLLHNSNLSTTIWMQAIYEIISTNFISSYELAKRLGITQKSAWLLRSKIDMNMTLDNIKMDGVVSMDEVYLGCHMRNMHLKKKLQLLANNNYINEGERYTKEKLFALNSTLKTHVYGLTNGEYVVLRVCPNPIKREYVYQLHRQYCKSGCITVSDDSSLYNNWEKEIGVLKKNCHSKHQYVTSDGFSSNPIENVFSWLERGYAARLTHTKHTQLYLNEFCFRQNTRHLSIEETFKLLDIGKQIRCTDIYTYNQLEGFKIDNKKTLDEMFAINLVHECELIKSVTVNHKTFTAK